ncbi:MULTISPECIES: CBS domain-containing protein [unclassified Streptomyces]|uniref:CBS domain-containing protein n=1 Tax=unclassified Streptomyces TaxID=2593676 RepID=UPI00381E640D
MKRRRVGSVMSGDVVRARGTMPGPDIARLLDEHDISGLPVVDTDDKVLGVVSATDLERPARPAGGSTAATAAELMSVPPRTVRADDSLVRAARLMTEHRVERLPVVDEEARLVGMVTRRDLLRIFLRTDTEIREEVLDEIMVRALWLAPHTVTVAVDAGVVTLTGRLENSGDAAIAVRMTRQVDGVIAVVDRLTHRHEAAHHQPA